MELYSKGNTILIDDEDFEKIKHRTWRVSERNNKKYVVASVWDNVRKYTVPLYLHRFLTNCPKGMIVDHINGNPLDNRKENLRIVNRLQNNLNRPANRNNKTSKYKGVSFLKNGTYSTWRARCNFKGKEYTKVFKTEREAALYYNELALKFHGEYAFLNDVEGE